MQTAAESAQQAVRTAAHLVDQAEDLSMAGSVDLSPLLNQLGMLSRITAASVEAAARALSALTDSVTLADAVAATLAQDADQVCKRVGTS
jgi:hypothetical protein